MAIRALNSVVVANYPVAANSTDVFNAGDALMIKADGTVVAAYRASSSDPNISGSQLAQLGAFVGFSADDRSRTGNTMILSDPVGSNYINGSGVLVDNNTGFYKVSKRAIGDFQDEPVTSVTNPTAGSTGYEGPRRGVGVFNTPGAQFVTDRFSLKTTNAAGTDAGSTWSPAPGDLVTFGGTTTDQGKLVKLGANTHGMVVGRVDKYDSAAGLLYFTQLSAAFPDS